MTFCKKCGSVVPDGATFCPKCGAPIVSHARVERGEVWDLAERLERWEITEGEAKREIYQRGLQHERYGSNWLAGLSMVGWGVLCFISGIAKATNIPVLNLFAQLPTVSFPPTITYLALVLALLGLAISLYATYFRAEKGGCGWRGESETIMFVREGPYRIMRHPGVLGFYAFFVFLTVFLSGCGLPFNILSVIGNLIFCLGGYYMCVEEEKLNIIKWGDEYRQYMREIPRFNFVVGLWRWMKGR